MNRSLDFINQVKFDEKGLVPAIAQDSQSGAVLMLAYMNRDALQKTVETKRATYFSRSRQQLWVKGETSGHIQEVVDLRVDCDGDAILLQVIQTGPACHTGSDTCFFNRILGDESAPSKGARAMLEDYKLIVDRKLHPTEGSYTNYLFDKGVDKICKKIGEEATEVVIAAKNNSVDELAYEAADLIYHLLVVMAQIGLTPEALFSEMEKRQR